MTFVPPIRSAESRRHPAGTRRIAGARRIALALLVFVFFLPIAPALSAETEAEMREAASYRGEAREVTYHGEIRGYLALPEAPEGDEARQPLPAIVLIHEWWGLNDDIRAKARQFADAGYIALAVDLYDGETAEGSPARARRLAGQASSDMEAAFANLRAAFDYLRNLPDADPARLASVGWCFGGGWSYQIAKNDLGAKASIIYYGRFNPADDLSRMRARIIGHFGENDRAIKVDNVRAFQAQLKTLSGEHEIFIYPNAGHSFANPDSPSYHQQSAEQAHTRTLAFLKEHL